MTVTEGDPTWAGPLAGEALGLAVYHVTEDVIKSQIDPDLYESEVGLVEMMLELEPIIEAVQEVRTGASAPA
jgi:betaine reductase|tara:strand:- start:79 stop:294 length:216 start_codon:yes stop_codon:yes gene_type:complete